MPTNDDDETVADILKRKLGKAGTRRSRRDRRPGKTFEVKHGQASNEKRGGG